VTVVMAVFNEERYLPRKLYNMLNNYDYPQDQMEFVIVSDGSTDKTNGILQSQTDPRLKIIYRPERAGKAEALNCAFKVASGEVVVFTDARQTLEVSAVRNLVRSFYDPLVGCVSGALHFDPDQDVASTMHGERIKMGVENCIRKWEGETGSTIGALGAFYATRRIAIKPIPPGTILDDCYIPLETVYQGFRCVFDEAARAWDNIQPTPAQEFARKVRTITGIYQLLRLSPWLISFRNPVLFELISHKLLRLVMPFAHFGAFLSAGLVGGRFYQFAFLAQLALLVLSGLPFVISSRSIPMKLANIALSVLILNAAAAVALVTFVTGKRISWAGSEQPKASGVM
jgi:biofilm PGA synthesis N-glycosyltransferase PgaC